ncbi:MAG: RnfABCDGE type electron transport complex subunit D [Proteobacteria bacterium]|nr:RnfABCDGE type electron transport complex subunit D [Pseudomonadota bacterium]
MSQPIELRAAPYQHSGSDVPAIMRNVVYAMLPICIFSVWQYGLSAAALILVVTLACLLAERINNYVSGAANTLSDWSAVITGVLLALTLPPSFPLWMGAVAGLSAIWLGKSLFGGLGQNPFNPALIGRAFVQAAFPTAISTWVPAFSPNRFAGFIPTTLTAPFMSPPDIAHWIKLQGMDAFTGATPLARWKFENVSASSMDFLTGQVTASAGETSAILILLCGLYLAFRKFLDWRIPVAVMGSVMLIAWAFHLAQPARYPSPSFMLLSGGLMLGAWFMATDMATSPITPRGIWLYGALIGILTVMIRYFGGLTEGVMYAILIANAAAPLLDQFNQPRILGGKGGKS